MDDAESYNYHYGELLPKLTGGECAFMKFFNITPEIIGDFTYTTRQKALLLGVLPLLMVIGLLDNLAFVYVVLRIPEMKTVTNSYLLNLAIADVLYLTFSVGEKLIKYGLSPVSDDDGALGLGGCIVIYIISDLAYFAGLFFVTLVSFDRFLAVHSPMASGRKGGRNYTQIAIVGTWIVAAVLAAIMSPSYGTLEEYCILWPDEAPYNEWSHVAAECMAVEPWLMPFTQGLQTLPFFISFVVNVILYIFIIKGLDQSIERLRKHGLMKEKDINVRNQIARMLVVNGLVFFCCLAPFEIRSLLKMIDTLSGGDKIVIPLETSITLDHIGRVMAYTNSAINPLIYTAMSSRYRQAFKQAFLPKNRQGFFRGVRTSFNQTLSHTTETHMDETHTESRF